MDLNFNVFNLLILAGAVHGLVTTGFLLTVRQQVANRFLALSIFLFTCFNVWLVLNDTCLSCYHHWVTQLPLLYLTGLGPALYFYTVYLIRPDRSWKRSDHWHFAPLALDLILNLSLTWGSLQEEVPTFATSLYPLVSPFQTLLAAISIAIYLQLSRKLLRESQQRKSRSAVDARTTRWLRQVFLAYGVVWLLWIPLETIDFIVYDYKLGIQLYYVLFLWLSVIAYWLGFKGYGRAQDQQQNGFALALQGPLSQLEPLTKDTASMGNRTPDYSTQEVEAIVKALKERQVFLDARLSLDSLAEEVGIPKRKLSFVINDHFGKNFNELVNEYRVQAVCDKLTNPAFSNYSILGIAMDCGFNSKSSFNRIFKKQRGITPVEFLQKHQGNVLAE